MESIIWDVFQVAVKRQTKVTRAFLPLLILSPMPFCASIWGASSPFRAGSLVRAPVWNLEFQVEFHLELSGESLFQFSHILVGHRWNVALVCPVEQSRQGCVWPPNLPISALDYRGPSFCLWQNGSCVSLANNIWGPQLQGWKEIEYWDCKGGQIKKADQENSSAISYGSMKI